LRERASGGKEKRKGGSASSFFSESRHDTQKRQKKKGIGNKEKEKFVPSMRYFDDEGKKGEKKVGGEREYKSVGGGERTEL